MNHNALGGNLTHDPEIRTTPNGSQIVDISLALNRRYKDAQGNKQQETTFVDVTFFGTLAGIIADHCRKGQYLIVFGRLQTDQWVDKKTGEKRCKLRVIGEQCEFVGRRDGGHPEAQRGASYNQSRNTDYQPAPWEKDDLPDY